MWTRATTRRNQEENKVYEFILEKIDSVPHLEVLLLVSNSRPMPWSVEDLTMRLYVDRDLAKKLLDDLCREELIAIVPGALERYCYDGKSEENDRLIELVDRIYRQLVVRISTLIHSKAPAAVRDFARAFRFNKGGE